MLDINKIQELALKADTLNDTKSFDFLQNSLTELKNNSNPQLRFLALRIENRLKENQNYNDYVKTQQEVKKVANNAADEHREQLRETQKQQLNATSAKLQQDKKKAEAFKNEQEELKQLKQLNDQAAYNQKINMIFEQLSVERQTLIRNLESEFNEENRQFVRNFVLDKTQTKEEVGQNLYKITSNEVGKEYVRYDDRTAHIDFSMQTPPDQLVKVAKQLQDLGNGALDNNNPTAAVGAYSGANNATVTKATQDAHKAADIAINNLQLKTEEGKKAATIGAFLFQLKEETFSNYQEQIDKINNDPEFADEEKQERIEEIKSNLQSDLKSKAKEANIDLSSPEAKEQIIRNIIQDVDIKKQEQIGAFFNIKPEEIEKAKKADEELMNLVEEDAEKKKNPTPPEEKPKEEKLEEVKTNEQEKGKLKQEDLNDLLTTKTDFRTDPDPNSEKIANKAADIMQATIEGRNQKMIEESQQPDNKPSYAEQINKQLREAQKEQEQQELNQNNNANLSSQK